MPFAPIEVGVVTDYDLECIVEDHRANAWLASIEATYADEREFPFIAACLFALRCAELSERRSVKPHLHLS